MASLWLIDYIPGIMSSIESRYSTVQLMRNKCPDSPDVGSVIHYVNWSSVSNCTSFNSQAEYQVGERRRDGEGQGVKGKEDEGHDIRYKK